jgi:hypothetical protein
MTDMISTWEAQAAPDVCAAPYETEVSTMLGEHLLVGDDIMPRGLQFESHEYPTPEMPTHQFDQQNMEDK